MTETLQKLSPHRDLQCYFFTPSAIAAISGASESGFTVSGKWRQQFDWAVAEWNRDNVFEHPALRYLPDGDLSGLVLTYCEQRSGCVPIESNLVPIVDWNDLRIWATDGSGAESVYHVNLWPDHAKPMQGTYTPACASMTLTALPGVGRRIGLAFYEYHHYYTVGSGDTLSTVAQGIAADISSNPDFTATSIGPTVTVTCRSGGPNWSSLVGTNGNRATIYGFAQDGGVCWANAYASFDGGSFPTQYEITLDFSSLKSSDGTIVPTNNVRKMRWTWAADLQNKMFSQTEFEVLITNWTVLGSNREYSVAGPGSRRIDDTDAALTYAGVWSLESGNYYGSRIHHSVTANSSVLLTYSETAPHDLYLGTRRLDSGANISVTIDGQTQPVIATELQAEDVLVRRKLATMSPGNHSVSLTHSGPNGSHFYFDFFEVAYPTANLPDYPLQTQLSLATDWDTYHSQSLPAERTAWLIQKLGFAGRVNHYAGAMWFYELTRPGTIYASLQLNFSALPYTGSPVVVLAISAPAVDGQPSTPTLIKHLRLPDDTVAEVVIALAAQINLGTNLVWAAANGNALTLTARAMGVAGNGITAALDVASQGFAVDNSSSTLTGGIDGTPYNLDTSNSLNSTLTAAAAFWRTDLTASPRLNRAARDWHQAFFASLRDYGIDCVAAFSTELMNGDPGTAAGIAQCYPDGSPVVLNTPAIQTNFSPQSLAFWLQVYLDMAALQSAAGMTPYLQSGEVQWWYFPKQVWSSSQNGNINVGMPFYDAYTQLQFTAKFGVAMQTITSNDVDPSLYPKECAFLPTMIGAQTAAIRRILRASYPTCRYEVLYPTDTNDTPLNQIVNFPADDWTPANLNCLKTESFTFTGNYNLDQSLYSIGVSADKGFGSSSRSHLIGIGDAQSSWMKEADAAQSQGLESVVLFALDQFCLIGYPPPPYVTTRRAVRQG